jgi:ribose transport system ATP-binding protein
MSGQPILSLKNVHKHFGPVQALKGVAFDIYPGEVHALIGENGAGKSTLMKVLSGAHLYDEGQIEYVGQTYSPKSPQQARMAGIAMIYQELTLAPHLTIEENITLGMEQSSKGFVRHDDAKITEALTLLGQGGLSPRTKVASLPIGTRQLIEIARAIVNDAKIVILDEPTSSLSREDTQNLFRVINTLISKGIAIIYISHFLEEIQQIAQRYTILRDGTTCGSGLLENATIPMLVEMMVGRSLKDMYPKVSHTMGEQRLRVKNLVGEVWPKSVSFDLRKGEILGIFGLIGAGRSEAMRCIYGLDPIKSGTIDLNGETITHTSLNPKRSLSLGIDFLSEDRKEEGLAQKMSIAINTTLSSVSKTSKKGWINLNEELKIADEWAAFMKTKCHKTSDPISSLSGGNQQKVAIARMLNLGSDILILDEPTRGIDVGSKSEIYSHIQRLASEGKSIIMVSSYLPELKGVCDTLAVMYRGILSPLKPIETWSDKEVMAYATTGCILEE